MATGLDGQGPPIDVCVLYWHMRVCMFHTRLTKVKPYGPYCGALNKQARAQAIQLEQIHTSSPMLASRTRDKGQNILYRTCCSKGSLDIQKERLDIAREASGNGAVEGCAGK